MSIRKLFPAALRRKLRLALDSLFCRSELGIERVGGDAAWWIVPGLVDANSAVLSGGAGNDISFELALTARTGCRVALFDPSPTGAATVARVGAESGGRVAYFQAGLAEETSRVAFAAPRDAAEGSFTVAAVAETTRVEFECLSAADAAARAGFAKFDLLKIDIEGFEYGFLASLLNTSHRPPQIAVEFHHFLPGIPWRRTFATIRALRAAGYRIAHKEQCDYLFVHRDALARLKRGSR